MKERSIKRESSTDTSIKDNESAKEKSKHAQPVLAVKDCAPVIDQEILKQKQEYIVTKWKVGKKVGNKAELE